MYGMPKNRTYTQTYTQIYIYTNSWIVNLTAVFAAIIHYFLVRSRLNQFNCTTIITVSNLTG